MLFVTYTLLLDAHGARLWRRGRRVEEVPDAVVEGGLDEEHEAGEVGFGDGADLESHAVGVFMFVWATIVRV